MHLHFLVLVSGGVLSDVAVAGGPEAIREIFDSWTDGAFKDIPDLLDALEEASGDKEDFYYFDETVPWLQVADILAKSSVEHLRSIVF